MSTQEYSGRKKQDGNEARVFSTPDERRAVLPEAPY